MKCYKISFLTKKNGQQTCRTIAESEHDVLRKVGGIMKHGNLCLSLDSGYNYLQRKKAILESVKIEEIGFSQYFEYNEEEKPFPPSGTRAWPPPKELSAQLGV